MGSIRVPSRFLSPAEAGSGFEMGNVIPGWRAEAALYANTPHGLPVRGPRSWAILFHAFSVKNNGPGGVENNGPGGVKNEPSLTVGIVPREALPPLLFEITNCDLKE